MATRADLTSDGSSSFKPRGQIIPAQLPWLVRRQPRHRWCALSFAREAVKRIPKSYISTGAPAEGRTGQCPGASWRKSSPPRKRLQKF